MTTGSLCLTEILMSRKSCSSNSEHSQSADSTSASAVALPCFSSSRLSSEPAFTPIRIGTRAADAARAISATLSSNCRMLPGLTRTAAQPASIAANTYFGWKWMSAMTGICDFLAIAGSASTSSCDGTATRTIWHPAAVSSAICWSVALTSAVSVVVIDCTLTGAPPPTGTGPTMICRVLRRGASAGGGAAGIPRFTAVTGVASLGDLDGGDDVGGHRQQYEHAQNADDAERDRGEFHVVDAARVGPAAAGGEPGAHPLVPGDRDVPAVHGQQREQVEDPEEQIQYGEQLQYPLPVADRDELAADPAGTHDADRGVRVAFGVAEDRAEQRRYLRRNLLQRRERQRDDVDDALAGQGDALGRPDRGVRGGRGDAEDAGLLQIARLDLFGRLRGRSVLDPLPERDLHRWRGVALAVADVRDGGLLVAETQRDRAHLLVGRHLMVADRGDHVAGPQTGLRRRALRVLAGNAVGRLLRGLVDLEVQLDAGRDA